MTADPRDRQEARPTPGRSLAWTAAMRITCPVHDTPPGEPCWLPPRAICAARVAAARPPGTPAPAARPRRRSRTPHLHQSIRQAVQLGPS